MAVVPDVDVNEKMRVLLAAFNVMPDDSVKVFPVTVKVILEFRVRTHVEHVDTNVAMLGFAVTVTVLPLVPLSSVTASPAAGPVVQVALQVAPPDVSDHVAPAFQLPVAMPKHVPVPVPQPIASASVGSDPSAPKKSARKRYAFFIMSIKYLGSLALSNTLCSHQLTP
jgi:hypothetical protein